MASALMISPSSRCASSRARSDLPLAVGPTTAMTDTRAVFQMRLADWSGLNGRNVSGGHAPSRHRPADAVGLTPPGQLADPVPVCGGKQHRPHLGQGGAKLSAEVGVDLGQPSPLPRRQGRTYCIFI